MNIASALIRFAGAASCAMAAGHRYLLSVYIVHDDLDFSAAKSIKFMNKILKNDNLPLKLVLEGTMTVDELIERTAKKSRRNSDYRRDEAGQKLTLKTFKQRVNSLRFAPELQNTALGQADAFILVNTDGCDKHQGISYFGGSSELSWSYGSVCILKKNSPDVIAKKILHEIGHLLGVPHDDAEDSIMQKSFCGTCLDKWLHFTDESIRIMKAFLTKNKGVFQERSELFPDDYLILGRGDAMEYISSRRRHRFHDIVKNRLGGKYPDALNAVLYLIISMVLYLFTIFIVISILK